MPTPVNSRQKTAKEPFPEISSSAPPAQRQHPGSTAGGLPPDHLESSDKLLTLPDHQLGFVTITKAQLNDLRYIDALQRKHVNSTGFVPMTAIKNHLERQSYSLLTINGQPVGYSMASGGIRKPFRLIQLAIQEDAWRTGLGTILIRLALAKAATRPQLHMAGTVREGLIVNTCVLSTGAKVIGFDTTPKARRRQLIHYLWDNSHNGA